MHKLKGTENLYLVHSSSGASHTGSKVIDWMQLELFASEKSDALIFTNLSRKDFARVADLISRCGVRNILDLRDLPSLTFEQTSRKCFFEFLSSHQVGYTSIHTVFPKEYNAETISTSLHCLNHQRSTESTNAFKERLEPIIGRGPTIVFTESSPELDHVVQEFRTSLASSDIKFSPVFAPGG